MLRYCIASELKSITAEPKVRQISQQYFCNDNQSEYICNRSNQLSQTGIEHLQDTLSQLEQLENIQLNLNDKSIQDKSFIYIFSSFAMISNLQLIQISVKQNKISLEGLQEMASQLEKRKQLKNINFNYQQDIYYKQQNLFYVKLNYKIIQQQINSILDLEIVIAFKFKSSLIRIQEIQIQQRNKEYFYNKFSRIINLEELVIDFGQINQRIKTFLNHAKYGKNSKLKMH
ncbi:hypothetical protein ABPG74_009337 [Tetrahymena malaccensis]